MKLKISILLFYLIAAAINAQTIIAYTSFEDTVGTGGQYVDTGDASLDHPLINNADQAPVNFFGNDSSDELPYSSYYFNTLNDVGLTDGDWVGVTSFAGTVGAYTDGENGFEFTDTDGMMETVFESVSVSGYSTAMLYIDYFVQSTGYEADDYIRIFVVVNTGDTVDVLNTLGSDINDLGIEGSWITGEADLSGYTDAELHVQVQSNSSSENMWIDNIKFVGTNTALPTMVQFESATYEAGEADGSVDITVSIANPDADNATTVDVVLTSGDAADLDNYATFNVEFPAGSSDAQTVTVNITDDSEIEGTEEFTFALQNVAGGFSPELGTPNETVLTLTDNDFNAYDLVITEIFYNPASSLGDDTDWEFFEIYNNDDETIDLSGFTVTDGVEFTFPADVFIAPGEFIVVTVNEANYQGEYQVFQWTSGALGNSGELLEISDSFGNVQASVNYDDGGDWPTEPDGDGPSLEIFDINGPQGDATNWRASFIDNGTPGYYMAENIVSGKIYLNEGWNLVSAPVMAEDLTTTTLFPAVNAPVYGYNGNYFQTDSLLVGSGYWVKSEMTDSVMLEGSPYDGSVIVMEGWNLIGPFEFEVDTTNIASIPEGIITSNFFAFEGSYNAAGTLMPGFGYWVKTSAAGEVVFNMAAKKGEEVESQNADALYTIAVATSDGAAGSYALALGIDPSATAGIDSELGETELPPLPPAGVYDARMIMADGVTGSPADFRTGDNNFTGQITYTVKYQLGDGGTGMTLNIDIPEIPGTVTMTVQDPFGGVLVNQVVNEGGGQVVVTNTSLTELKLIVDYNAPIPVELSSFTANIVGETIQLAWETATETNNKGFEVERSEDKATFTKVGYIEGKGTTSEKQSYSFTDHHAVSGTYYYRLRQVDFDGTSSYSEAVEVDFVPTEYSLGQNYPNPFNPSTKIKFAVPVESKVTVTLYNMLGQKVKEIVSRNYSAGLHEVDFNASELSSGMYIYSITAQGVDGSNFVDTKKMMLMK